MRYLNLAEGVVANGNGASFALPPRPIGVDELLVHIQIETTATVTIQGRLHPDLAWVDMVAKTASEIVPVAWVPYLRAVVSGWSAGAVDVKAGYF